MKAWYPIACLLIAGAIAFFVLRPAPKPKAEAPQGLVQEPKTDGPETNPRLPIAKVRQPPVGKVNPTNDPLAGAYQMAAFIDAVRDSVPPERYASREHLKGLQVVFFVSDYVMAAKTNSRLMLSKSAIITAFTNVSQDTSSLKSRLPIWAERSGTLTDHYQAISRIPEEKDHINTIETVLAENGVRIDTESDLLMDCIRYVVSNTDIHEMYGPNPRRMEDATPYPPALNSLVDVSDTVFRHRFIEKFGLDPRTVTNLMSCLREVRLYGLSPADVEIPAHLR